MGFHVQNMFMARWVHANV